MNLCELGRPSEIIPIKQGCQRELDRWEGHGFSVQWRDGGEGGLGEYIGAGTFIDRSGGFGFSDPGSGWYVHTPEWCHEGRERAAS